MASVMSQGQPRPYHVILPPSPRKRPKTLPTSTTKRKRISVTEKSVLCRRFDVHFTLLEIVAARKCISLKSDGTPVMPLEITMMVTVLLTVSFILRMIVAVTLSEVVGISTCRQALLSAVFNVREVLLHLPGMVKRVAIEIPTTDGKTTSVKIITVSKRSVLLGTSKVRCIWGISITTLINLQMMEGTLVRTFIVVRIVDPTSGGVTPERQRVMKNLTGIFKRTVFVALQTSAKTKGRTLNRGGPVAEC